MADIRSKVNALYSLEQLSSGNTVLHRIHPGAKLVSTFVYLICTTSVSRYDLIGLTSYLFYPIIIMSIADIPYKMIIKRALVSLPFCLFAGISNLIFDRNIVFTFGLISITGGFLSFIVLLFRTMLCVCDILILVSLTPFASLTEELRYIHIPSFLVSLLEMTYRYISVLLEEGSNMVTAFRLRSSGRKSPNIREFGTFIGQLLLRSFDRAERVYHAMQCRLYGKDILYKKHRKWKLADFVFLFIVCGTSILFRFVDIASVLGELVW